MNNNDIRLNKYDENSDKLNPLNWPEGTKIYCILRHESRSGMFRVIDMLVNIDGEMYTVVPKNKNGERDKKFPFKYDYKRYGWRVSGCGMDMGFHLVYSLCMFLFFDSKNPHGQAGYRFKHVWL